MNNPQYNLKMHFYRGQLNKEPALNTSILILINLKLEIQLAAIRKRTTNIKSENTSYYLKMKNG